MLVSDAGREQVKHLFKRTVKDYQYAIKAAFDGAKTLVLSLLLEYSASLKTCNNWNSFHNDIENIKSNLIKNAYPPFLIDKVIKKYLDYKFSY